MEPMSDTFLSFPEKEYSLVGEHLTLFPYLRGHYHRDILHDVWTLIELDNAWDNLFWNREYDVTPVALRGDLTDWISYVEHPVDRKSFLIALTNDTHEIAGLIWFYNMKDESAQGSIWMARKFNGAYTREAVLLGLEYGFRARKWQTVWAGTPWPVARNLLLRCGFKLKNEIDELYGKRLYLMSCKEADYARRIRREQQSKYSQQSLGHSAS